MNLALPRTRSIVATRAVVVLFPFALAALALGLWISVGPTEWMLPLAIALLVAVGAWAIPLGASVLVLVALVPLQLYFVLTGSTFSLRVAVLFAVALALRVLPRDGAGLWARWRVWTIPVALFIGAAFIAAWGAPNRYLALKGIYDWLPFFATFFILIQVSGDERLVRQVCIGVVLGGIAEALWGLTQYVIGLETVVALLRLPLMQALYQPNLLQERLVDLSFNWVSGDRILPFGTFINGIDFAVYIAAVLALVLALPVIRVSHPRESSFISTASTVGLAMAALVLTVALILTLKGSGFLALAGGLAVIALCSMHALSGRVVPVVLGIGATGLVIFLSFSGPLIERITFLIEREQGLAGTIGRLGIWTQLLGQWTERPWFGFGLNNSTLLAEPTRTLSGGAFTFISTSPESAPVALLVEVGLVGFIGLCLLIGIALVRAYRAATSSPRHALSIGVLAALVALLFGNLTVSGQTTDQNGMLLGILVGIAGGAWNRQ